ncbi:MAG: HlyD family efflux transporter periplasmic adaptor subunit [Chitinophagales bacterium]|nr:HlyD family efflux transporter periplasmic adaptor subunit [Chitinophagales bacterium]
MNSKITKDISKHVEIESLQAYNKSYGDGFKTKINWVLLILFLFLLLVLFLPWTQNIQATGVVTTFDPNRKPQQINALIAGRIERWYVREGQVVKKGDTLLTLSEVKAEYLDPALVEQTYKQMQAKQGAVGSYASKAEANETQLIALKQARELKLEQLRNKINQAKLYIITDSMAYEAAVIEANIADSQMVRQQKMFESDLISKTDLERRQQNLQSAKAKLASAKNKFAATKQELLIAELELGSAARDYAEKIAKTEAELFATLSSVNEGTGEVAKLENLYNNYKLRNSFYVIIAPQDGQVMQTIKAGVGEVVKEGETLMSVVPVGASMAVEIFVRPNDFPLVHKGETVMLQFDGYPAVVFSGWPSASYGIFEGVINTTDEALNENGNFRVLISPDSNARPWPEKLKFGNGAQALVLLKEVPIWYELWRQVNGFPAEFYTPDSKEKKQKEEDKK